MHSKLSRLQVKPLSTAAVLHVLLILLLWRSRTSAQNVDPKVCTATTKSDPLPPVPDNLHAIMSTVTNGTLGHLTIMANVNSSRFAVTYAASPSVEVRAIFDAVTNQVLVINNKADQFDVENCQVQNVTSDSFHSMVTKVNFLGSWVILPTPNFFSASNMKVDNEGYEFLNSMNTIRYRTCHFSHSLKMTMEVIWWASQENGTFVQMRTRYGLTPDGKTIETYYFPTPLRSMPDKQDAMMHQFTAPKGVYCRGLVSVKPAPSMFERLSLNADYYVYNLAKQPDVVLDSFRESYDQSVNLSMTERDANTSSLDKNKYGNGRLARINDFTRGISYIKNLRFENCTYEKITANDWDSNPDPSGARIKRPDELYFPSQAELQYKGTGVYRSTDVDIYLGYKDNYMDIGDGRKYPFTIEYYLNVKTSYDGAGNPSFKSVPIAAYCASTCKYYSLTEIFDFKTDVPRTYDHDISDCFAAVQKLHYELLMPFDTLDPSYIRFLYDYRNEFSYSLVKSLSKALNISPLRIFLPIVSVFADPLFMLVEVTFSEKVTVSDYKPSVPETDLSEIAATMTSLIAKGTLVVDVNEGDLLFQVPVKNFTALDSRGPPVVIRTGLPTGAVAGLAVGSLLLGAAIGSGILLILDHFRRRGSSSQ